MFAVVLRVLLFGPERRTAQLRTPRPNQRVHAKNSTHMTSVMLREAVDDHHAGDSPCACRIRVVLNKRAFSATRYYRPARTRATREMRIPSTVDMEATIAILPIAEQHNLELLAYSERVDLV